MADGDGADFWTLARCVCFLLSLQLAGRLCKEIHLSPIIGEILVGVVLGPEVLAFVPYASVFDLAGLAGVTLMIFESGLHVNFSELRAVGLRATIVAVVGTVLPIATTVGIFWLIDERRFAPWPVGIAAGAALAPTSVGMALKLLSDAGALQSSAGQIVVAAAFVDDALTLVMLTALVDIGLAEAMGVRPSAWDASRALLFCGGLSAIAMALSVPPPELRAEAPRWQKWAVSWIGLFPRFVPRLTRLLAEGLRLPAQAKGDAAAAVTEAVDEPPAVAPANTDADAANVIGWDDGDDAVEANLIVSYHLLPLGAAHHATLALMLATLAVYTMLAEFAGSHVLGAFLAGLSFCWAPGVVPLWHSQARRIGNWLVRCFFGATVAFAIPVRSMMGLRPFALGMLILGVSGILAKALPAVAAGGSRGQMAVVGTAMMGRGEFAFLVARSLRSIILNPAQPALALDLERELLAGELSPAMGGGFCLGCGPINLQSALRARSAAGRGPHPGEPQGVWCAPACIDDGSCFANDTLPVTGGAYWRSGPDCDTHAAVCGCASMMPADAFAIVVWALVGAALITPLCFAAAMHFAHIEDEGDDDDGDDDLTDLPGMFLDAEDAMTPTMPVATWTRTASGRALSSKELSNGLSSNKSDHLSPKDHDGKASFSTMH